MSLKDEDRRIIVTLELERVDKTLKEMDIQRRNGLWGMAIITVLSTFSRMRQKKRLSPLLN